MNIASHSSYMVKKKCLQSFLLQNSIPVQEIMSKKQDILLFLLHLIIILVIIFNSARIIKGN